MALYICAYIYIALNSFSYSVCSNSLVRSRLESKHWILGYRVKILGTERADEGYERADISEVYVAYVVELLILALSRIK